jgi:predicted nucleotidyltransferase
VSDGQSFPLPSELHPIKRIVEQWASSKISPPRKVTGVYLFGSRVTGRSHSTGLPPRPDSDLDVAVSIEAPDETRFTDWMFVEETWRDELAQVTGLRIDLQLAHAGESPCVWKYLHSGGYVRIYGRPLGT